MPTQLFNRVLAWMYAGNGVRITDGHWMLSCLLEAATFLEISTLQSQIKELKASPDWRDHRLKEFYIG
ncbi:hypothetical protein Dda_9236 [Drechslerella dactyloides]|uniref:BTB domain-containing protein n=1 Tax=Drechslerella dactyloides TaxID=74499 RepID=A0AAD6IR05_DREDA|nr:hypothetical protein Dda_9236 [Drechslerella dactyloides]